MIPNEELTITLLRLFMATDNVLDFCRSLGRFREPPVKLFKRASQLQSASSPESGI